jgi:pilus assembly protein Flp/PilA
MLSTDFGERVATPEVPAGEGGQGLVEYGLIVGLIAVACMIVLQAMGTGIAGVFTRILGRLSGIG